MSDTLTNDQIDILNQAANINGIELNSLERGNPPFLMGLSRRIHAAIFSFTAGVMPPMPMLGRPLLYIQSLSVAWA